MPFALQPHLENELVRLAPLGADDFEALYAVASDPLIWEQHPNRDRHRREVFATYFTGAIESGGALRVLDGGTGELLGSSRYYGLEEAGGVVCVGYTFLARSAWARGYNRALKELMLDHAFRFVDRVMFHVGVDNLRSRRAMEKLGGVHRGEIAMNYHGEPSKQNVIYTIDKGDWRAAQPALCMGLDTDSKD